MPDAITDKEERLTEAASAPRSWRLRGYATTAAKKPDVDRVCPSDVDLDLAMKELEAAGYERITVVPS